MPIERTIAVVDEKGRPVEGAKVVAYSLGDRSSSTPRFRDVLGPILPDDGPLTAITGANGRASFTQLPRTALQFLARKPGFAENYAFREQSTIHLSPSASLSGTATGPDGRPLAKVKIVLYANFMHEYEYVETDAKGYYHIDNLKAHGWDMIAWGRPQIGDGKYTVWIDSEEYAVPTQVVILEPGDRETLDLKAEKAGVIRVKLIEAGSNKAVAGARISGFGDHEFAAVRCRHRRKGSRNVLSCAGEVHPWACRSARRGVLRRRPGSTTATR